VESRPAGGTVVRLVFPRRPANHTPAEHETPGRNL
jgi:hypothetical protein